MVLKKVRQLIVKFTVNLFKRLNKLRRGRVSKGVIQKQLLWQHDNGRPHDSHFTVAFFEKQHIHFVKQSPYSPDLNLYEALKKEIKPSAYFNYL